MKIKVIKVFFEELNFLKKKRATDDEMAVWHLQFTGQELGPTPGGGEGQGSPVYCSTWGCKEVDTTWQLNNNIFFLKSCLFSNTI